MKNKKWITAFLALACFVLCGLGLTACNFLPGKNESKLAFQKLDGKREYAVVGMGEETQLDIVVPSTHNGLPVTEVGDNAFVKEDVTSITLPDSVTAIGAFAFSNCKKLTSVTLPNVRTVGTYALNGCENITAAKISCEVAPYVGSEAKECLQTLEIVSGSALIEPEFSKCVNLKSVKIADTVTRLGNEAFYFGMFEYCSSLTNVELPDGLIHIGPMTFFCCTSLTNIEIPDSVISIGSSAFSGCSSLTDVELPESLETLGHDVFEGCNQLPFTVYNHCRYFGNANNAYLALLETTDNRLTDYTMHENTKVIADCAFQDHDCITNIAIPDGVTSIGNSTFVQCDNLTSISIPDGITMLNYGAFWGCDKLQFNEYQNGQYLGNENNPYVALLKTTNGNLTTYTIHENTKVIGCVAFSGCSNLTSITIPDSVTTIEREAFSGCSSLTSITIPDSVTSIGDYAFSGCSSLTSITIPDSVTMIGGHAFYGCRSLTSVTMSSDVKFMGWNLFGSCNNLTSVTFNGTLTQWNKVMERSSYWNSDSSLRTVVCSDGTVTVSGE